MERPDEGIPVRTRWAKLGLVIAVLHYVFLLIILLLLRVDLYLAVSVAIGGSIVGGVALMLFVRSGYME